MRLNDSIGRRYATALFQVASQHPDGEDVGRPSEILSQLEAVANALGSHAELKKFFLNPVILKSDKKSMLDELNHLKPAVIRFLKLLVEHGRLEVLNSVVTNFRKLLEEFSGEMSVELKTAHTLSEVAMGEIRSLLESLWGQRVKMSVSTEPELIGGFVALSSGKTLDGSIRSQLENLRHELEAR
jgi:F-type H+-transporting ATPase subunit delta